MVNKELLRETMDQILAEPERWNQSMWAKKTECGTAYCFAGWTCALEGYEAEFDGERLRELTQRDNGYPYFTDGLTHYLTTGEYVGEKARDLLGLTEDDARLLFYAGNSLEGLKHGVDVLCAGGDLAGEILYDPDAEHL